MVGKEVRAAFSYVRNRLGLGRTVDFLFEETSDNLQTAIMRAANEKEAPNEWYIEYNPDEILRSMEKQEHSPTEYIRSLALHEILHMLGWELVRLGEKGLREKDKKRLTELEEAMVRTLEALLRPLVVRCTCKPKGKKRSARSSTQSNSTGPNPHTGATLPNTAATDAPAISGTSLEGSSTTPSATTTEGASPKGTSPVSSSAGSGSLEGQK